jgi:excisionase family DNA binding protein
MTALLTAQQAAELLGVPPSWLLRQARAGKLPHVKLGHYTRFDAAELEAWLAAQHRGA